MTFKHINYNRLFNRTSKRYRIYKYIDRISESEKDFISKNFPVTVEIFPTNTCNINCKFCSYKNLLDTSKLETQIFNDLVNELIVNGVKSVVFSGGGEPTLHEFLPTAIGKLTKGGVKVGLITNGININNPLLEVLNKCSWIRISLNSYSKESYVALTGNKEFIYEKIIRNINKIRDTNFKLVIGITIIVQEFSKDSFVKAIEIADKLSIDQIFFKPLLNGFNGKESSYNIKKYKNEMISYSNKYKVVTNIEKLISYENNPYMHKEFGLKCPVVNNNLVTLISANADVYPCIHQYTGKNKISYGNLYNESLGNIFQKRFDVLKRINDSSCDFCRYGNLIREIYDFKNSNNIKKCSDPHSDFI